MKIVYMGTPEFAGPPLSVLYDSRHDVVAVVTGQDKPSGRGRQLRPTICKQAALERNIPCLTPKSLKSTSLVEELRGLEPDLFVVIAFRILPEKLYSLPRLGAINIHASLLPKYRGAAPVNWALINGEAETGLTSFFLQKEVDTGNIIRQEATPIRDDDNFDSLYRRLSEMAGPFLLRTLDRIESGDFELSVQDSAEATPAPKITPEDTLIEFDRPASAVRNFIRGLSTRPGACTRFRDRRLKVHAAALAPECSDQAAAAGTILPTRKRFIIQCKDSALELTRVVPEGRKEMDGISFINGLRPQPGEMLTSSPTGLKEQP